MRLSFTHIETKRLRDPRSIPRIPAPVHNIYNRSWQEGCKKLAPRTVTEGTLAIDTQHRQVCAGGFAGSTSPPWASYPVQTRRDD